MSFTVIDTKEMLCPSCMEEHKVDIISITEHLTFKNEPVTYLAEYYHCDLSNEFYSDESMTRKNDLRMKDAYRKKTGLLTSKEIIDLRKKYELTQSELCALLNWGGKTITRYETHQVQDKAHDSILRKLNDDPEWFLQLLDKNKTILPAETYLRCFKVASKLYESIHNEYVKSAIKSQYSLYWNNSSANGNTMLSLDKVVDVIRFFSNSSDIVHLFKVKLMKLLWYADSYSYKIYDHTITGLVYKALPRGAVPVCHELIINLSGIYYEENEFNDYTAYHFLPSGTSSYPSLNDAELSILNMVANKFGNMTMNEIVNFMHNEDAYKNTKPFEIIDFHYSKTLHL